MIFHPNELPITLKQKKFVRSLRMKKYREDSGCFFAEGRKCIEELHTGYDSDWLLVREDAPALEGFRSITRVTSKEMQDLSVLTTPTDYIAVFDMRVAYRAEEEDASLIVALDGIQDPGNMGTILRTCDWMGVRHVVCSPQTVDYYSPKVVQASMGALAHVQVSYEDLAPYLHTMREQGYRIYGTLLDGNNIYTDSSIAQTQKAIIVMGNEGNGLTDTVCEQLTDRLTIPSFSRNHVESLNVSIATAIVLSEFRRTNTPQTPSL